MKDVLSELNVLGLVALVGEYVVVGGKKVVAVVVFEVVVVKVVELPEEDVATELARLEFVW